MITVQDDKSIKDKERESLEAIKGLLNDPLRSNLTDKDELIVLPKVSGIEYRFKYVGGYIHSISFGGANKETLIVDTNDDPRLNRMCKAYGMPVVFDDEPLVLDELGEPERAGYSGMSNITFIGIAFIPVESFNDINKIRNDSKLKKYLSTLDMANRLIYERCADVDTVAFDFIVVDFEAQWKTTKDIRVSGYWHEAIYTFKTFGIPFADPIYFRNKQDLIEKIGGSNPYNHFTNPAVNFDSNGIVIMRDKFEPAATQVYEHMYNSKLIKVRIKEVNVLVGLDGALQPFGVFDPVEIKGVTISSVPLYNYTYIDRTGLMIGDLVVLKPVDNHGVIIERIMVSDRQNQDPADLFYIEPPAECPGCGEPIDYNDLAGRSMLDNNIYCENIDCPERKMRVLMNFVRTIMVLNDDQQGVDEDRIRKIFESNKMDITHSIPEILGYTDKKNNIKNIALYKIIKALGIRDISHQMAVDIADSYDNIQQIQAASIQQLVDTVVYQKGNGDKIRLLSYTLASSIYDAMRDPFYKKVIEDMLPYIQDKSKEHVAAPDELLRKGLDKTIREKFINKKIAFDGSLTDGDRMKEFLALHGAIILESKMNFNNQPIFYIEVPRKGNPIPDREYIDRPDYVIYGHNPGDIYFYLMSMVDGEGNLLVQDMPESQVMKMVGNYGIMTSNNPIETTETTEDSENAED